jgi:hypothetical protein
MRNIISWLNDSSYIKPLSPACKMCAKGSKLVLLITGLCPVKCFYCPLSTKKLGKDRIFADELELENEKDTKNMILEAELIDATGAGITGGDPLIVWRRTKEYISILKDYFGTDFHIHLYTTGIKNGSHIDTLVSAGLDEIRFHPPLNYWADMNNCSNLKSIKNSLDSDVDVAIEIPVIPSMKKEILSLIKWANNIGIKWINLNELEFSETNAKILNKKGFTVKNDISAALKGSQEIAYEIIETVLDENFKIGVHYCSSSFKDGIQLRNRIRRRADNISKKYDVITDEGTLLKGIVYSKNVSLKDIYKILKDNYRINTEYIFINKKKKRIEIAIWTLEKIANDLKKQGFECYIIEEYPTADGLEVERIPLPL